MNEAILLILADEFECRANKSEERHREYVERGESAVGASYAMGKRDAYADVAARLRRIVEGASANGQTA